MVLGRDPLLVLGQDVFRMVLLQASTAPSMASCSNI